MTHTGTTTVDAGTLLVNGPLGGSGDINSAVIRSLAETARFRLKANFGDRLKNQTLANQATEVALRCKLLNTFVALGLPLFAWG